LHFVIAEQPQLQQRALDGYVLLKNMFQKYGGVKEKTALKQLKGIGIESPLDFPGLQAADGTTLWNTKGILINNI
jgi:hypothetical protein